MSEPHSPTEFHESDPHALVESLCQLVDRLGPPPQSVIESWCNEFSSSLPEDFRDWDLSLFGVTATATLVRLDNAMSSPTVPAPDVGVQALAAQHEEVDAHNGVDAHEKVDAITSSSKTPTRKRPPRRRGKFIAFAGLAVATVATIAWATRRSAEPFAESRDETSVLSEPVPKRNDSQASNRLTSNEPTSEPVEALSTFQTSADIPTNETSIEALSAPIIDPAMFALDSLLPSMRTDESQGTTPMDAPLAAKQSASMDDVLSAGDDDPPPETPQPIRDAANQRDASAVARLPTGNGPSSEANELWPIVQTDPLAITFDAADQQPTWDLHRVIPTSGVHLSVSLELPEDIDEGWIEPLDEASPRRSRGIAVLTPRAEESVAIGLRMDVRCSSKLSIRIRYAARLDPTLPWQPFTREALLKSADYFGQQSLFASTQAEQIESMYSKSDTYGRRALRDQRDLTKTRVENLKLILQRLGELDSLAEKIESAGVLTVKLTAQLPEGQQTILETVASKPVRED